jgi:DNA-binding beta-propeller fold protein YncE
VDAATGTITTVAGFDNLDNPWGIALDAEGNLYVADRGFGRVILVDGRTGIGTIIADGHLSDADGHLIPANAETIFASDVAVDSMGNVYVADSNNGRVLRIDAATGRITTVAGTGELGYRGDHGPATAAQLNWPRGVEVDGVGNLYIANMRSGRVRRVDAGTGVITTIADEAGPLAEPVRGSPMGMGIAVDRVGNIYVADGLGSVVRKLDVETGVITTIAGTGEPGYGGDGGPATAAVLKYPSALALDAGGNLYIADTDNSVIRVVIGAAAPAARTR